MINTAIIAGMVTQLVISLFVPIGLLLYFRKKKWLSWKPFGIGVLIFVLFSQVLEKALHVVMIDPSGTSLKWTDSVALFVLYATLAAGIFEEVGRYIGFRWMLKKHRDYKDGLSFGLGHGGIEAILIGVLGAVNAIVLASLIQSGAFDKMIAPTLPKEQAAFLKDMVLHTPFSMYVLGGLERLFAIAFHIAMSLLVLLGVRERKFRYVIYAILLHALVDTAPALYQAGVVANVWLIEAVVFLFAVAAFLFTREIRKKFESGGEG
ncbi:YhfC family intramembrane metalloprotease [Parageobacillus toebii]|uniref:YhfC family intramembrane metalloprotease n=1 Tax=Parageobacillus toebii TaxID=153151 RepID=UPI002816762C|nr:YhfC family intramembrane metalloprotease [Parageobacillus toebii]WMT18850.1 YhfC family intramembrane metalloprotease [Parageobacillus toebii]